jgi:hypothetical protein
VSGIGPPVIDNLVIIKDRVAGEIRVNGLPGGRVPEVAVAALIQAAHFRRRAFMQACATWGRYSGEIGGVAQGEWGRIISVHLIANGEDQLGIVHLQAAVRGAEHLVRLVGEHTVVGEGLVTAHERQRKASRSVFWAHGGSFEAALADARAICPMGDTESVEPQWGERRSWRKILGHENTARVVAIIRFGDREITL